MVITSSLIGAGIYVAASFFTSLFIPAKNVPAEFSEARIQGAELARQIVTLSDASLANLDRIAEFDRRGNSTQALSSVAEAVIQNRRIQDEAIQLSSELERMARLLDNIKPSEARILATEAVSSEVALVSRLLRYQDYFGQLFQVLDAKFQHRAKDVDNKVHELVSKINEEASAINDSNGRFTESLAEFDKLF